MSDLSYKTAVVALPPEAVWPPIQAIRLVHDRKLRRWMPHLTLRYPFVPAVAFPAAKDRLLAAVAEYEEFPIELVDFHAFHHREEQYTIWLRPEPSEPLLELHEALCHPPHFPAPRRSRVMPFQPHLSVGQVRGKPAMQRLVAELQAAWTPLRFWVSELSVLRRNDPPDDVFRVAFTIPLRETPRAA